MENNEYNLITNEQQLKISSDFFKITDVLNSTGLYNFLKENDLYQKCKKELVNLLVGVVENGLNQNFHKNLNFFEKLGFLSNEKWIKHQRKIGFYKGLTSFALETTLNLAPAIIDYFYKKEKINNLKEFVIGGFAYINQQNSVLIQKKSQIFYRLLNERFEISEYKNIFERYASEDIKIFPYLKESNESEKYKLFNFILSASDLSNSDVRERSQEFGEYLGLSSNEIIMTLDNIKGNEDLISDIAKISAGITLTDIFKDLSESLNHAKQYSFYSLENDPYAKGRIETKQKILNSIKTLTPIALSSLGFYGGGEIGSLIRIASPIVSKMVNSEIDINKEIKIQKGLDELIYYYS